MFANLAWKFIKTTVITVVAQVLAALGMGLELFKPVGDEPALWLYALIVGLLSGAIAALKRRLEWDETLA